MVHRPAVDDRLVGHRGDELEGVRTLDVAGELDTRPDRIARVERGEFRDYYPVDGRVAGQEVEVFAAAAVPSVSGG